MKFFLLALLLLAGPAAAQDSEPAYGPELQGFEYPFPVGHHAFDSQGTGLQMAYLDVPAVRPNGRVAVLLHGKNFCAATWEGTIRALTQAGYRVVAPDQVGFCASSKPAHYQYTFQQLVENTRGLLRALGVAAPITLVGHSTGGMMAMRWALMYSEELRQLVLVDPIGLEDWKDLGVPPIGVDGWFKRELAVSAAGIRAYEQATYYAGTWRPEYERWVGMLAGLNRGPGHELVAWNSALVYDMIFTQPVVYELERIRVPTLLMVGDKDTTAIGKDMAPPAVRATLGDYPVLAKAAAARIGGAQLIEFPALGHAPQIQAPEEFHAALLGALR